MSFFTKLGASAAALAAFATLSSAQAAPVSFVQLTGVTGDPGAANTAVFQADLSTAGLSSISSIVISDSGVIGGSAPGQFSGFDLDAVIISTVNCATAACVAGLTSDVILNYAGAMFTPGTQSAPTDPKLFGTNGAGTGVDDAVAHDVGRDARPQRREPLLLHDDPVRRRQAGLDTIIFTSTRYFAVTLFCSQKHIQLM